MKTDKNSKKGCDNMSMRFRKTIKLGKGVNLNFNKNSVGISVGSKAGRITVNSKGRKTTTMHTPIKGVSFVNTQSSSSNKTPSEAVYVIPVSYTHLTLPTT